MKIKVYKINRNYEELIQEFQNNFRPVFKKINHQRCTAVFIIERYYIRIESNLTITIIFDKENENLCNITIIISGGKHGLFELSWGAEKSALKKIMRYFEKYNF